MMLKVVHPVAEARKVRRTAESLDQASVGLNLSLKWMNRLGQARSTALPPFPLRVAASRQGQSDNSPPIYRWVSTQECPESRRDGLTDSPTICKNLPTA